MTRPICRSSFTTWSAAANALSVAVAVAEAGLDRHVARHFVPHRRRAGLDRVLGVDDERQLFVVDLDRFGGVERLVLGFGDHHRHRLADMARLVGRQQHVRTDEHLAAARRVQLHVVAGLRQRIVRDRPELVGEAIGAGEHAEHALHRCARAMNRCRGCAHADRASARSPRRSARRTRKSSLNWPRPVISRSSSARRIGFPMKR